MTHPREFVECALGSLVNILVGGDEASIEAPFATSGIIFSAANENLQFAFVEAEDNTVDRYQNLGITFVVFHCFLPEVSIEAGAETDDDQCADDVECAPALLNRLLKVCREGDGVHLLL